MGIPVGLGWRRLDATGPLGARRDRRSRASSALLAAGACAALLVSQTPARAGLRFHTATLPASGEGATEHATIWVDGDQLAYEARRPDARPARRRMVFRADLDVIWLLDAKARTYYQLDPETAADTASQLRDLRQGLEAGIEALGPENGERVRELLGDLGTAPDASAPVVEVAARGEESSHAELRCAVYDVRQGGAPWGEVCLASYGQGALSREQLRALPALFAFLGRTLPPLLQTFPSLARLAPLASLAKMDGVPIQARTFERGRPESVTTLRDLSDVPLDPALFRVPTGYARSWIPPFAR